MYTHRIQSTKLDDIKKAWPTTLSTGIQLNQISIITMKPIFLTLLALTTAVVADKTCTPSFDYCANTLIKDKGKSSARE